MENWNHLSDEEKARLRSATPIAKDDADAISTPAGWARWQEKCRAYRESARGKNGPDVANARFYIAATKGDPKATKSLFLECERATDARKVATILLGGVDVDVQLLREESMPQKPADRIQVRWTGLAARLVPDLRIQTRRIVGGNPVGKWKDL